MKYKYSKYWIPIWVDKWLLGSTRIELQPAERSVWIDLLVLAAKDNGHIRANKNAPYAVKQLAGFLCVPEELLSKTIERCIEVKKLKRLKDGTLYIKSWSDYSFTDRYIHILNKRKENKIIEENIREAVPKKRTSVRKKRTGVRKKANIPTGEEAPIPEEDEGIIQCNSYFCFRVISYLNKKTGKNFSFTNESSHRFINGRLAEGRTFEDFKKVIDLKVEQWKGTENEKYLRPETLFNRTKFEGYINEVPTEPEKEKKSWAEKREGGQNNGEK